MLGSDAFVRRKGHCSDGILCDLEARHVLDVSPGRKKDDVICVRERLTNGDGVEAVPLCFPRAHMVADHVPVIQHVGNALNTVIGRWARKEEGKRAFDGQRHLF